MSLIPRGGLGMRLGIALLTNEPVGRGEVETRVGLKVWGRSGWS